MNLLKDEDKDNPKKLRRLSEIDTQFVSLVRAGANRQRQFLVVKQDDEEQNKECEKTDDVPAEGKRTEETVKELGSNGPDLLAWLTNRKKTIDVNLGVLAKIASVATSRAATQPEPKTPEVAQVQEPVSPESETIAKLEKSLEESRQHNERMREELRKFRRELTAMKARNVTLTKSVGESSAIVTGTVSKKTVGEQKVVKWTDDLASSVAED